MHRRFRKYIVSLFVVPTVLLGVVFGAIAAAPAASTATARAHMTHVALVSARPQDEGPISVSDSEFTTLESSPLSEGAGTLLAGVTDSDPGADGTYTVSLVTDVSDGTLSLDANDPTFDGGFTYAANSGFAGTDSFQFTLTDSDGNVSDPATVTITVEGVASAPAQAYSIPTNANWSVPSGVLLTGASDTDSAASCCTADVSTSASNGTVTLDSNGDGGFTYTPDSGFQGTDSFTYTLTDSDGNVSAPTTVSLGVGDPAATKTSIIETDPPSIGPGDKVTFVASVKATGGGGGPAPTGTITFTFYTVGLANCGPETGTLGSAPVSSGEATLSTTYPTDPCDAGGPNNGSVTINATYNGDTFNAASNGLIEYYVLAGCTLGSWPSSSSGYPSILAGGPEGYYIGQSNGWYTVYVTQPTGGIVNFGGTVTTDGLILSLSSTKNEGHDKVTLDGSNEVTFKLVNHGDLDGFTFYAGCGSELTFTLNIGKPAAPAKRKQIFLGGSAAKSPTKGGVELTRP